MGSKNGKFIILSSPGAQGTSLVVLLVYVDDIILAGLNLPILQQTQQLHEKHFKLKILGRLQYFLGLEIGTSPKGIHLCQHKYEVQPLQDTSFLAAKPFSYPVNPNLHLNDIIFFVNKLSQYMTIPTLLQSIIYCNTSTEHRERASFSHEILSLKLSTYVDADYCCLSTRKSTSSFCDFLGDSLINQSSKEQPNVARSSVEEMYQALDALTSELLQLKQLLFGFEVTPDNSKGFCDSQSAIQLASNPIAHDKSKYINIDCHYIREHVASGFLKLIHVLSQHQLADPLTKALPKQLFISLISQLGLHEIYHPN